MSELVTIASGLDLQEAYLLRARLEGSGIECFIENELLAGMRRPELFASGVGLRVFKEDFHAAMELLTGKEFDGEYEFIEECEQEAAPALEVCCPECKFTEYTQEHSGFLSVVLRQKLLGLHPRNKICKNCGLEWQ